jgi:hypothetical protein
MAAPCPSATSGLDEDVDSEEGVMKPAFRIEL